MMKWSILTHSCSSEMSHRLTPLLSSKRKTSIPQCSISVLHHCSLHPVEIKRRCTQSAEGCEDVTLGCVHGSKGDPGLSPGQATKGEQGERGAPGSPGPKGFLGPVMKEHADGRTAELPFSPVFYLHISTSEEDLRE
ncbi:uncharacterized [Tachysurus ichikawai]